MAISLEQVNAKLAERGKNAVTSEQLFDALDFASGFYKVPSAKLNADVPAEQLILAVALLAAQAPFTHAATAAITSKELEGSAGSIKTTYADAPTDPYPVIGGLLAPFAQTARSGISFGVSTR